MSDYKIDKKDFTHYGSFYGVPIYLNLDNGDCVVAGRNRFYDRLHVWAGHFHNYVVEPLAQMMAAALDRDYEPGFPMKLQGRIEK